MPSIPARRSADDEPVLGCGGSATMNRIVRDHYPASKLPDDLREGIDPGAEVVVTVEEIERPEKVLSVEELWALRRPPFYAADAIVGMIREGRDERDG